MMLWASVTAALTVVSPSSWVFRLVRPLISLVTSAVRLALSPAVNLVVLLILEDKPLRVARRRLISLLPRVIMRCTRALSAAEVLLLLELLLVEAAVVACKAAA